MDHTGYTKKLKNIWYIKPGFTGHFIFFIVYVTIKNMKIFE